MPATCKETMSTHIPALSYKLFPPQSSASCESLLTTIDQLAPTNPDYVSVTWLVSRKPWPCSTIWCMKPGSLPGPPHLCGAHRRGAGSCCSPYSGDRRPRVFSPGVWDVLSPRVPQVDEVEKLLATALEHIPARQL